MHYEAVNHVQRSSEEITDDDRINQYHYEYSNTNLTSFNFGYLHQVYAYFPVRASLVRVVCSPFRLPSLRSATRMSRFRPRPLRRSFGAGAQRGGLPSATLRVSPPPYVPSTRRRPLARGPMGAVPPRGLPVLIGIEVWCA